MLGVKTFNTNSCLAKKANSQSLSLYCFYITLITNSLLHVHIPVKKHSLENMFGENTLLANAGGLQFHLVLYKWVRK